MDAFPISKILLPSGLELRRRELECLYWVSRGKSSMDIGSILGISRSTVETYIAQSCAKLGVRTRVEAAVIAVKSGWIAHEGMAPRPSDDGAPAEDIHTGL